MNPRRNRGRRLQTGLRDGGGGTFLPQTSSLQLWLRADTGTTIATGVSSWKDKVSQRNYTQGTGSAQPTLDTRNGLPSLRFTSASSQVLNTAGWALAQPMEIFIVMQLASTPAASMSVIDVETGNASQVNLAFPTSATKLNLFAGGTLQANPITDATAALAIYRITVNGNSSAIYQNGVSKASGAAGADTKGIATIGANVTPTQFLNGWISEILEYAGPISSTLATQVTRYLGARYGIAVP